MSHNHPCASKREPPADGLPPVRSLAALKRRRILARDSNTKNNSNHESSETSDSNDDVNNNDEENLAWRQKIGTTDNLLSRETCDELIAIHKSESHGGYIDHLEVTCVSDLVRVAQQQQQPELALPLVAAHYKLWEAVEEHFSGEGFEIFPEFIALVAWHPGAFLRNH